MTDTFTNTAGTNTAGTNTAGTNTAGTNTATSAAHHLADVHDAFWSAAGAEDEFGTISFDRCVDWLLDLHQSSTDEVIRALIADVLEDLRQLGPFDASLEDLVLGALASVEAAIDIRR